MESFHKPDTLWRPLSVIADLIREYEARPDRPRGQIVSRYVAEAEPEVFDNIIESTGLTASELWRFIEDEERKVSHTIAGEASERRTSDSKYQSKLRRLDKNDENLTSEKIVDNTDFQTNEDEITD
jgi:hypothetical protein